MKQNLCRSGWALLPVLCTALLCGSAGCESSPNDQCQSDADCRECETCAFDSAINSNRCTDFFGECIDEEG